MTCGAEPALKTPNSTAVRDAMISGPPMSPSMAMPRRTRRARHACGTGSAVGRGWSGSGGDGPPVVGAENPGQQIAPVEDGPFHVAQAG